jgi:hypothetical protein
MAIAMGIAITVGGLDGTVRKLGKIPANTTNPTPPKKMSALVLAPRFSGDTRFPSDFF